MSDDGNDSLDDVINNLNGEKFKTASPSLFEDSSVFQKNSERNSSTDFMAHQVMVHISGFYKIFTSPTVFGESGFNLGERS